MTMTDPTLPLPPTVLARLRTAESLRAELAGITAERDALRTELDTAGWERDTAQNEAAYLRDEILGSWARDHGLPTDDRIGKLLTSGDEPPPPPERRPDGGLPGDIALVSLSSGAIYIRPHDRDPATWAEYGKSGYTDWPSMIERGPWVTIDGWRFRRHVELLDADRRYRDTTYHANVGRAEWPEATADARATIDDLVARRSSIGGDKPEAREWIEAWLRLAGATRSEWQSASHRAEYLTEIIRRSPHDPEWIFDGEPNARIRVCNVCLVPEAEHLPVPETATP